MHEPSRAHPRILLDGDGLERLRRQRHEAPYAPLIERLTDQAEADLQEALPRIELADDLYVPGGDIWEVRYLMEGQSGLTRAALMGRPFGAICDQIPRQAFAFQLDGDDRYRQRAIEAMTTLAALPLPATGYANTHTFHGTTSALAVGLDSLWSHMDEAVRDDLVAALVARATEFHGLSLGVALHDPLDSHAIMYGAPGMTHASLALYHHRPEATGWLEDVSAYFTTVFPGYGGDDGGWAQGFGYGDGVHLQTLHTLWLATGLDVLHTPWGRNNPYWMLYFQPPCGITPSFGDAGYARPKGLQKQVMSIYAQIHQDPRLAWFGEQIEDSWPRDELFRLSVHLTRPPSPKAVAPVDLPQARHQRDIGWVAMHSCLGDGERNVSVYFKSSPFGSYSHSHADQNSLVVTAFGQPLLTDSGYYPWYGSPHDMQWSRQTRAHNAVLVNGKGQGVFNRAASGRIIAFTHGRDFDYTVGDATAAYREPTLREDTTSHHQRKDIDIPMDLGASAEGVARAVRHILFVRPATIVVLDDVETEAPAAIQLQWHGCEAFDAATAEGRADTVNGSSLARLRFLGDGPSQLTQTDLFPMPPEHDLPNQWHLTVEWAATTPRRLLLTVIQVCRVEDAVRLAPVSGVDEEGALGVDIGTTQVRFDLDEEDPRLRASAVRPDGGRSWFEHSVSRSDPGDRR